MESNNLPETTLHIEVSFTALLYMWNPETMKRRVAAGQERDSLGARRALNSLFSPIMWHERSISQWILFVRLFSQCTRLVLPVLEFVYRCVRCLCSQTVFVHLCVFWKAFWKCWFPLSLVFFRIWVRPEISLQRRLTSFSSFSNPVSPSRDWTRRPGADRALQHPRLYRVSFTGSVQRSCAPQVCAEDRHADTSHIDSWAARQTACSHLAGVLPG